MYWGEENVNIPPKKVANILKKILIVNASVSLYMFAGGTNFGFTNGKTIELL